MSLNTRGAPLCWEADGWKCGWTKKKIGEAPSSRMGYLISQGELICLPLPTNCWVVVNSKRPYGEIDGHSIPSMRGSRSAAGHARGFRKINEPTSKLLESAFSLNMGTAARARVTALSLRLHRLPKAFPQPWRSHNFGSLFCGSHYQLIPGWTKCILLHRPKGSQGRHSGLT